MIIIPQSLLFLFFLFQWIWGPTAPAHTREKGPQENQSVCPTTARPAHTGEKSPQENHSAGPTTARPGQPGHISETSPPEIRHMAYGCDKTQDKPFSGHLFPNDLMEHEEWILLKGLDSLCADTWCEGSFDFHFQALKCSFKEQKCLMSYMSQDQTGEYSIQRPFSFICVLTALNKKELFGAEQDFWVSSYLYSGVTECIKQGESWIREE